MRANKGKMNYVCMYVCMYVHGRSSSCSLRGMYSFKLRLHSIAFYIRSAFINNLRFYTWTNTAPTFVSPNSGTLFCDSAGFQK